MVEDRPGFKYDNEKPISVGIFIMKFPPDETHKENYTEYYCALLYKDGYGSLPLGPFKTIREVNSAASILAESHNVSTVDIDYEN